MLERKVTLPQIGIIAATRVAFGLGIGLLLSEHLNRRQRKTAGLALAIFGAATTIPIVCGLICNKRCRW